MVTHRLNRRTTPATHKYVSICYIYTCYTSVRMKDENDLVVFEGKMLLNV
jgi:hypothetical protein